MSALNVMGKNVHIKKETGWGNAYGLCWYLAVKPRLRKEQRNLGISLGLLGAVLMNVKIAL